MNNKIKKRRSVTITIRLHTKRKITNVERNRFKKTTDTRRNQFVTRKTEFSKQCTNKMVDTYQCHPSHRATFLWLFCPCERSYDVRTVADDQALRWLVPLQPDAEIRQRQNLYCCHLYQQTNPRPAHGQPI